jgi:outer membrane protein TolC
MSATAHRIAERNRRRPGHSVSEGNLAVGSAPPVKNTARHGSCLGAGRTVRLLISAFSAVAWLCPITASAGEAAGPVQPTNLELTLADLRERVLQRNETLQARLLSFEAQRRRARGQYGLFEPQLFGSYTHEVNNRQNTSEQQASLLGAPTFSETNNNYESGLEGLIPSGARVRLGYTLRELRNTLEPVQGVTNGQYQSFLGVTVTQPILKDFGTAATMAGIRVAAISNKMAFQEYRRDLMSLLTAAEGTYWNMYLTQEQIHFLQESVKTAETLLRDNRARLEAGMGSELEVQEAEAGLGLRQAKLAEAEQKGIEAVNRVLTLFAETAPAVGLGLRAIEVPRLLGQISNYEALIQEAFESNPDFLIAVERVQENLVRLGYARNQRLPQLDLRGSYGLNGLGDTVGSSWSYVEHSSFPSWYVGAELRIPITGGLRSRNELVASRLDLESSQSTLRGLQTEILNSINTAWRKMQSTRGGVSNYETAVKYNQSLLQSALVRAEAGKLEVRKVFEIEADLLEARVSLVDSLVRHQIAALELELSQGVYLQRRHLELTQRELALATEHFGQSQRLGDAAYQQGLSQYGNLRRESEVAPNPANIDQQPLMQDMIDSGKKREMQDEVQAGFRNRPETIGRPANPSLDDNDPRFSKLPR